MSLTRSRKRSYSRHAKKSHCKGKRAASCRHASGCKLASGRKRSFCRKSRNVHTRRFKLKGGGCGLAHTGGKRKRRRTRKHRRTRKRSGGVLAGVLQSARTALLPFLLYKGQKRQQRRVRRRTKRRR